MFIEEFASLVLNTIFLFSQLTQLEHFNRRNTLDTKNKEELFIGYSHIKWAF
jgi:hypothetical protein